MVGGNLNASARTRRLLGGGRKGVELHAHHLGVDPVGLHHYGNYLVLVGLARNLKFHFLCTAIIKFDDDTIPLPRVAKWLVRPDADNPTRELLRRHSSLGRGCQTCHVRDAVQVGSTTNCRVERQSEAIGQMHRQALVDSFHPFILHLHLKPEVRGVCHHGATAVPVGVLISRGTDAGRHGGGPFRQPDVFGLLRALASSDHEKKEDQRKKGTHVHTLPTHQNLAEIGRLRAK